MLFGGADHYRKGDSHVVPQYVRRPETWASRTPNRQARRRARRRPAACRLAVEALEDRLVPATLTISDVTIIEGDAGTPNALVTVTLSAPTNPPVTVDYGTADGTALAGSDYQAVSGTLTFDKGQTSRSILVPVTGDRLVRPDETLFVNLRNATRNDRRRSRGGHRRERRPAPPTVSVNDVSAAEGNSGRRPSPSP
jgi:hypothetical protein